MATTENLESNFLYTFLRRIPIIVQITSLIMEHPENNEAYKGLVVNAGIEQPSSVNPYRRPKPRKRQLSVAEFVEGIVKGDVTILSQAVTLVESVKVEHQAVAQEVI